MSNFPRQRGWRVDQLRCLKSVWVCKRARRAMFWRGCRNECRLSGQLEFSSGTNRRLHLLSARFASSNFYLRHISDATPGWKKNASTILSVCVTVLHFSECLILPCLSLFVLFQRSTPAGPRTRVCSPTRRTSRSALWCWVTSRGQVPRRPTRWGRSSAMATVSVWIL